MKSEQMNHAKAFLEFYILFSSFTVFRYFLELYKSTCYNELV